MTTGTARARAYGRPPGPRLWSSAALRSRKRNSTPHLRKACRLRGAWPRTRGLAKTLGGPVTAISPDGGTLVYTLSGEDADLFEIDSRSGQISVRADTALDYEGERREFTLCVTATDPSGLASTVKVVVQVEDVRLESVGDRYDANSNEVIDQEEVVAAVFDYYNGLITKDATIETIRLYLEG